ncbi:hypothetical protein HYP99_gp011 [Sinorhizobium phage ort11]|uniref:Transmembrane protein n=1 Tax=Sinorhizobium phage ort11 TaxID=2599764 RepID=A0A5C2H8U6_9CAUD|nr:hypothetical protein HYP99_gp011 [Sinorhizobium phage ort11]QEP29809.1 hypothetical protein Smphiort11_011 [Sinorhizobium phage ort11]
MGNYRFDADVCGVHRYTSDRDPVMLKRILKELVGVAILLFGYVGLPWIIGILGVSGLVMMF